MNLAMDLLSTLIALFGLLVLVAALRWPLRPLDHTNRIDDAAGRINVQGE